MSTDIRFYGFDILRYYWYVWQNAFSDYPWQIYIAWLIVVLSIFTMLILAINFFVRFRKTKKFNNKEKDIEDRYYEKIKLILSSDELEESKIIGILGDDYEDYTNIPQLFIPIITKIHMELNESYFPNMTTLCNLLNITSFCENNLLKDKDVFNTLQFLCINNIIIMEGRLANYVNHKNVDIRVMARLCYIFCSYNNPYKYLKDELRTYNQMKLMFLHFILVWMKMNNNDLPDFDDLKIEFRNNKNVLEFLKNEEKILC